MTGSGGWPTSIFMSAEQKPFFAGTYLPKRGVSGHLELVYVYWQDGTRWLLRPMWEVTVRQAATEAVSFDTLRFVRVDAMTGDEM